MAEVAKSTGVSEGREKPEQGQSSSPTEQAKLGSRRALQCPPEPLWALTTNQARILWNAPEFPHGPSFSSWVQALASQGTEFRSQLGPSLAAQGIPDVPPPTHTHTDPPQETPVLPAVWVAELKTFLWAPILRGHGSTFKLRDCQRGLTTAIFLKEKEEDR